MTLTKEGLDCIRRWEGLRLEAYRDTGGVLTIGYGHTGRMSPPPVTEDMKITKAKATQFLKGDLKPAEEIVRNNVKVPLTDNQYSALVSFVFNIGAAQFRSSTLLRKLNKGDYDAVPVELMRWVHDNGKRVQGLVNRRAAEAGLWARGEHVSSNTEEAKAEKPPAITKETVSWGAGIASTLGTLFAGQGPVQYALAAVLVVAFAAGLFFFIKSRTDN